MVFIKYCPKNGLLKHLKAVVLNLYVAYLCNPLIYVEYSRGSDAYRPDSRLRKLHLGFDLMKTVDVYKFLSTGGLNSLLCALTT